MAKQNVIFDAEKGEYRVETINKKGERTSIEAMHTVNAMSSVDVLKAVLGYVKDAPRKRDAALNLVGYILRHNLGNGNTLDNYRGKCDRTQLLPNPFKECFRDAEKAYFDQWMQDNHAEHKMFVGGLPKENEKHQPLHLDGKLNQAMQYSHFLKVLRQDPSYNVAKNMVLSYFGYCGALPFNQDHSLIPIEVMRVYVDDVRNLQQADTSFKAKLRALLVELQGMDGNKLDDKDLPALLVDARTLFDTIKGLADNAAARITANAEGRAPSDVKGQSKDAIDEAQSKAKAEPATV